MRKKKESEYHTGRLNISCPPSVKDRIAEDATEQGLSISQFILQLYDKSTQAGSSEHLARMGLDMVGLKKRLVDIDTHLRRSLSRSQGTVDSAVLDDLARLKALETELDETLRETVDAVKRLKAEGK
ncbi:MAG: hypothetical protein PUH18_03320 [Coriobacteriaceae bacterium]|nr:hypothetical protein [Coriobacteriaceae bacterium]MDD7203366.1 hypothetical protein [Coriobacteriaceae bacterium]